MKKKLMKPTKNSLKTGTYVTRSVYNKVLEENKKLKHDMRILVIGFPEKRKIVEDKWRLFFQNDLEFNQMLKEVFDLI